MSGNDLIPEEDEHGSSSDDFDIDAIPRDADKFLFAVDLVRCVMRLRNLKVQNLENLEHCRNYVPNGFTSITKAATVVLSMAMKMEHDDIFSIIESKYPVNSTTFRFFEEGIRKRYFPNGFNVENLLLYSIHLSTLATYFFRSGVQDAPKDATQFIDLAFENFDMTEGGWDALNKISERYAANYIRKLRPVSEGGVDVSSNRNNIDVTNDNSNVEQSSPAVTAEREIRNLRSTVNKSSSSSKKSIERPGGKKLKISSDELPLDLSNPLPVRLESKILTDANSALEMNSPGPSNVDQKSNSPSIRGTARKGKKTSDKNNPKNQSISQQESGKESNTPSPLPKSGKYDLRSRSSEK